MRVSVRIIGGPALAAKFRSLSADVSGKALENATLAGAMLIENQAKALAPVLTGNLRRSIHSEVEESSADRCVVIIGTDVEYGPYQEYGTRYMRAHPFLRPAFDTEAGRAQQEIAETLRDIVARI